MRAPYIPKIGDVIRCKDTKATEDDEHSVNNVKLLDERNSGKNKKKCNFLANFSSYVYYGKSKKVLR